MKRALFTDGTASVEATAVVPLERTAPAFTDVVGESVVVRIIKGCRVIKLVCATILVSQRPKLSTLDSPI